MLQVLFACFQYLIAQTTPGFHSFSLKTGKYLVECLGPQNKYEEVNDISPSLSKGEYVSISISIEGKEQYFTAFLGNQNTQYERKKSIQQEYLENIQSKEFNSTFIALNSPNKNKIIAIAESGKILKKIETKSF